MKFVLEHFTGFGYSHSRNQLVLLVCLATVFIFAGCQSIPLSVIGAETREGLDDLAGKQTESAITAERIIASTGEVSEGLELLAEKAPDELKPEISVLSGKSAESGKLAKILEGQLKEERRISAKLRESTGKDGVETARITAERDRAKMDELKAKNQRNIACGIVFIICAAITLWIIAKVKGII